MNPFNIYLNLVKYRRQCWKSKEELEKIQNEKLKKIIKHAYDNVPFYREKFNKAKIKPEDIRTVKDLEKIPFTTKNEIAQNFPDKMLAKGVDLKKCWITQTSGSTGIPLTVAWDSEAEEVEKAVALRPNFECGQSLFDKWFVITSPAHIMGKRWFQKLGIINAEYVSLFSTPEEMLKHVNKFKPNIIDGYASCVWLIAKHILKGNKLVKKPKLIYTTSEMLDKSMRRDITKAFGVEPLDQFGCVEVARTAWECNKHEGFHMDVDAVIMEFIKNGKPAKEGEKGEIVYTTLYNFAMPLIRYRVGDVGSYTNKKCSCGRGLPLMEALEGRSDDFVKTSDGRTLSPIIGTIMFRDIKGIKQFKFIQEKLDKFTFELVKDDNFSKRTLEEVKQTIKSRLGTKSKVTIKIVDKVERSKSGKLRSVVSKVKS